MPSRRPTPGPHRRRPLSGAFTYRIRVDLLDTAPAIWRLIEVPSTLTLDALHPILQTAMGWTDSHLHQFVLGDPQVHWPVERYLAAFDIDEGDEGTAEADVRLDEVVQKPGDELRYTYDFGDGWDHLLRLDASRPRTDEEPPAALLDGKRACPPEDCGGPYGYDELLALLARVVEGDRLEDDEAQRVEWACGDDEPTDALLAAERLDAAGIDADLRAGRFGGALSSDLDDASSLGPLPAALAGEIGATAASSMSPPLVDLVDRCDRPSRARLLALVAAARLDAPVLVDAATVTSMVEPFAWFVRHVGIAGRPLTAQGYLRPADVTAVAERLHLDDEWIGTMNRESLTPAVAEFRRSAQRAGLLRVAKGRIYATARGAALADDPVALWRHFADRLPTARSDHERDAGMLVLLALAAGSGDLGDLMTSLGWKRRSGRPLDDYDVRDLATTAVETLLRLGCFDTTSRRQGRRPTTAGRQFARAALRA